MQNTRPGVDGHAGLGAYEEEKVKMKMPRTQSKEID
jgi:hypothetical protein